MVTFLLSHIGALGLSVFQQADGIIGPRHRHLNRVRNDTIPWESALSPKAVLVEWFCR